MSAVTSDRQRAFRATQVRDANIWLTTGEEPIFRIIQMLADPANFIVEQRNEGTFSRIGTTSDLTEAKNLIDTKEPRQ